MTSVSAVVIITVVIALAFDVVNGFHDAANSIATVVSTRVLKPQVAVLWAAFFNFIAMFFFAPKVADTISKIVKIRSDDPAFIDVVLTGLIGAIVWDLVTWWWGLPTSSSHALIGGVTGAGVAHARGGQLSPGDAVLVPLQHLVLQRQPARIHAELTVHIRVSARLEADVALLSVVRELPASVDGLFRRLQLVSAALYSLGHGGNDAQKTMGIIMALLVAAGLMSPDTMLTIGNPRTLWIILSCHAAMGLGTAFGGWRIVRTMGMKLTKLKPVGGFCAESAGAFTLFLATRGGIPVSTTHTITGSIVGVGGATQWSGVKWGIATRIVWAWLFTIPVAAAIAAGFFYLFQAIHLSS